MKKIITLSLVFVLFLSSCSIDWNWEKDKKIVELEKELTLLKKDKENDLFKKKQECEKYKDWIQKELELQKNSILNEVFYSPVKNTCYSLTYWLFDKNNILTDILQNEKIIYDDTSLGDKNLLFKKIKELKWE